MIAPWPPEGGKISLYTHLIISIGNSAWPRRGRRPLDGVLLFPAEMNKKADSYLNRKGNGLGSVNIQQLPAAEDLADAEAEEPAVIGIELVFILEVEAELPLVG